VLEPIPDPYIFGLCIGLFGLLILPLANAAGADDALTKFVVKRNRILAKERRAWLASVGLARPERPRKLRPDGVRGSIRTKKRKRVSKPAAKTAKAKRATRSPAIR